MNSTWKTPVPKKWNISYAPDLINIWLVRFFLNNLSCHIYSEAVSSLFIINFYLFLLLYAPLDFLHFLKLRKINARKKKNLQDEKMSTIYTGKKSAFLSIFKLFSFEGGFEDIWIFYWFTLKKKDLPNQSILVSV